jgi:hypothetical protein
MMIDGARPRSRYVTIFEKRSSELMYGSLSEDMLGQPLVSVIEPKATHFADALDRVTALPQ